MTNRQIVKIQHFGLLVFFFLANGLPGSFLESDLSATPWGISVSLDLQ